MSLKIKQSQVLVTAAIIATILFTGLVIAGLFARPIADDLAYLQVYTNNGSVLDASLSQYLGHSGRLSQVTLVYLFFAIFGNIATRVAPFILLVTLAGSVSLLTFVLLDKKTKDRVIVSSIAGLLVSSSVLITVPSLFDSLYWLTSSTVYITSLTAIFLTSALIVSIFKHKRWQRLSTVLLVLPIVILYQSFGEVGALTSIAISGLAVTWTVFNKKWRHLLKPNLVVFVGLFAGFLVNYLSPGTAHRRQANEGAHSLSELYRNMIEPFQRMFSYVEWWHITLALLIALVIFYFLPKNGRKPTIRGAGISSLTVVAGFLLVCGIAFGVSALSVGPYFAIRNYTVPSAWLFLSIVALMVIGLRLVNPRSNKILYSLLVIISLSSIPYAINKQAIYVRAMAVRDSFYSQREVSIHQQVNRGRRGQQVKVPPVQVLLSPTEAADLEDPDKPVVEWVSDMIGGHYDIPNYTRASTPKFYCVPVSKYVRHDLTCGQTYSTTGD